MDSKNVLLKYIAKKMFYSRSFQAGVVIVGITAATGIVAYLVLKDHKNKYYKSFRKKWTDLGDDVVVLHRSTPLTTGLSISPFDIKVGIVYYSSRIFINPIFLSFNICYDILIKNLQFSNVTFAYLKLETFLRIAGIKYFRDFSQYDMCAHENGGLPWITWNGETDVFDSQLCVEYLGKKFNADLR